MRLDGSSSDQVIAYVDASYGVHTNRKSHTGVVISIGNGPVFISSTKQRLVTKSSTEAELVGLSDALSQVLWTRHFMQAQGYPQKPALILQDNESTIRQATYGRSNQSRMRHVDIRYFFIKDRMVSGDCEVQYIPTKEMVADMFTKPLQGELFRAHRSRLMCESDSPSS